MGQDFILQPAFSLPNAPEVSAARDTLADACLGPRASASEPRPKEAVLGKIGQDNSHGLVVLRLLALRFRISLLRNLIA
ncbi:hypothetical protein SBA4_1310008 [Candidatus Sulfopaludibacter sp. SbA4]|nr:hypothetical protein SBA4_1310008 [Candidatus Sulfopaludibacter sp. SbA4]